MAEHSATIDSETFPSLPKTTSPITDPHNINIGTRKSHLARVQTDIVVSMLSKQWPQHTWQVHAISTMGDKNQVTALHDFGAKSLWTHELEAMLLAGQVDFIVHSLKDIPTQMPPQLTLGAVTDREDPRDALVMSPHKHSPTTTLSTLPAGSIIGTSSLRRSAQLKRLYPQLQFQSVRGNVGTRLSKLDAEDSPYSALILAAAGLIRVDLGHRITGLLDSKNVQGGQGDATRAPPADSQQKWGMLHAVGQGALGIQIRENDDRVKQLLAPIVSDKDMLACLAERSLMRTLEGGCSVPIGVETEWSDARELTMRAIVVSVDGSESCGTSAVRSGLASHKDADEFGREVAADLVKLGAGEILKNINLDREVLEKQADGA